MLGGTSRTGHEEVEPLAKEAIVLLFMKNKGTAAYKGMQETPLFPKRDIVKEQRNIALALFTLAVFGYLLVQFFGHAACPT
jgi:hypothetical protein